MIAPLGAPVIILGGILGGFVTPTEAAAVGAAYMALLGFAYRTLRLRDLPKVLVEAAVTTGSIMLIVASANLLGYVFARERVPQELSELDARPDERRHGVPAPGLRVVDGARAPHWTRSPCSR